MMCCCTSCSVSICTFVPINTLVPVQQGHSDLRGNPWGLQRNGRFLVFPLTQRVFEGIVTHSGVCGPFTRPLFLAHRANWRACICIFSPEFICSRTRRHKQRRASFFYCAQKKALAQRFALLAFCTRHELAILLHICTTLTLKL